MANAMDIKQDFKNRTINVDLYSDIRIIDVIKEVEEIVGTNSVIYACPLQGNLELTFDRTDRLQHLNETPIIVNNQELKFTPVGFKYVIVSFMHIPVYISDHEILAKLEGWNVKPLGEIRHRKIKYEDREIPDGTRYIKCEFPPNVNSLPYATMLDGKSFIVKHNNQAKVCFGCLNPDHEIKNCPDSKCKRCGQRGHIKKFCEESVCINCGEYTHVCKCISELKSTSEPELNPIQQFKETTPLLSEPNTTDMPIDDNTLHPILIETPIDRTKPIKRTQTETITPPKNENKKGKTNDQIEDSEQHESKNSNADSPIAPNVNPDTHPNSHDGDTPPPEKSIPKKTLSKYPLPPKAASRSPTLNSKINSSMKTLENIDNIVSKRELLRRELADTHSFLSTRNRFKTDPIKPNLNAPRKSKSGESLV
ncbi:hypothetical protein LOTGIDRAFT_175961 [Lottia gigantea]|uniref:CCHC-type domain-containing protein n=1 Tax=Lottia gigantea TaxID=225164 RepID=V3ZSN9_LOTGI|nr:hypothetical protein LOTGIDRAFT_175961 [Lottia gigantea]ESO87362.1 hypothetical protein LOTGIDRAFT_175961 [Lottia gigantea]